MLYTTRLNDTTLYDIRNLYRPYHRAFHSIPQFIANSLGAGILIHACNRDYGSLHEGLGLHVPNPRAVHFLDNFHRARNCFMEFAPRFTRDKIPTRSYGRRITHESNLLRIRIVRKIASSRNARRRSCEA